MALDLEINEEKFNTLADGVKGEYVKQDNGTYRLDVGGLPDVGGLSRALDRQKADNAALKAERDEFKTKLEGIDRDKLRQSGDIATLEKQWAEKSAKEKAELQAKIDQRNNTMINSEVNRIALEVATKLSDSSALLIPHIKARLAAEIDPETDVVKVRVNGADGKVSALSLDDLGKEFAANKDFAAIIRHTKSSGSNGTNGGGSGGGANGSRQSQNNNGVDDLSKASASSLAERIKARKQQQ